MTNFKISLEIELNANNPLDAAKTLLSWIKDDEEGLLYYVQNDETKEIFSVDLSEDDEDAVLSVSEYDKFFD